jgi:hypothetical protein
VCRAPHDEAQGGVSAGLAVAVAVVIVVMGTVPAVLAPGGEIGLDAFELGRGPVQQPAVAQ